MRYNPYRGTTNYKKPKLGMKVLHIRQVHPTGTQPRMLALNPVRDLASTVITQMILSKGHACVRVRLDVN